MNSRELDERRQRLMAISAGQRVQLRADLQRFRDSVRESVWLPARLLKVPLFAAAGMLAVTLLLKRRSRAVAAAVPLAAGSLWLRRGAMVMRLWPWVRMFLARRGH